MITKVEFREQLAGYREVDGVQEDVYWDFWVLLVDDDPSGRMRQAGYVWKAEGSPINLIRRFSPDDLQRMHALVEAEKGPRLDPCQPPEVADDDDEEEDDTEDE